MQRQSARKLQQEITLSSNQLCTRTRQPRLHIVPRHLRQHLLTQRGGRRGRVGKMNRAQDASANKLSLRVLPLSG